MLFVFPEGTRSRDGALQEGRDGVASLALRTGAPIVPVGIAGSDRVWPRGQKLPHPGGRVTVRVGSPFRLADELPPERRQAGRQEPGDDAHHAADRGAPPRAQRVRVATAARPSPAPPTA